MSPEERYDEVKEAILTHIQNMFVELEQEMAMSHQEKYALLEDSFEGAADEDELRVAFERWYADNAEDLKLDYDVDELWESALNGEWNYDNYSREANDDEEGLEEADTVFSDSKDDSDEDY